MTGMFDDLIPAQGAPDQTSPPQLHAGMFDDLIPQLAQAPQPGGMDTVASDPLARSFPNPITQPAQNSTFGDIARAIPSGLAGLPASTLNTITHPGVIARMLLGPLLGSDTAARIGGAADIGAQTAMPNATGAGQILGDVAGYQPQTIPGQYTKTVASFLPAAIGGPSGMVARSARVLAPALASETAGQLTKGTPVEPYARLAGGLVGGAGEALAEGVPNVISAWRQTPEQRARGVVDQFAGGPVNIDPRQIVPGSEPTLAEAMTDNNPGVAGLQRTVRNMNPQGLVSQRELENSTARSNYFAQLSGTPADVESAALARDAVTGPMREAAFSNASDADASNVNRTINQILASPAGQRDAVVNNLLPIQAKLQVENPLAERISDAIGPIKDALSSGTLGAGRRADFTEARRLLNSAARGYTSEDELVSGLSALAKNQKIVGPIDNALTAIKSGPMKFESDPQQLYGIRKAINDQLAATGPKTAADARLASSELLTVRDALDKSIQSAAPGYTDYLAKYSEMSKPIDQMQYLQSLGLTDQRGNLTLAKVKNALANIAKDRQAPGVNPAKSLTDDQITGLQNLHADLHAASNIGIGNAVGSNTVQNAVNLNAMLPGQVKALLGRFGGPEVAGGTIGGGIGYLVGQPEIGAAFGAGAGRIISHGLAAKNKAVTDAIEQMVLNPRLYQNTPAAVPTPMLSGPVLQQLLRSGILPAANLANPSYQTAAQK